MERGYILHEHMLALRKDQIGYKKSNFLRFRVRERMDKHKNALNKWADKFQAAIKCLDIKY